MKTYISLLRGINITGHRKLLMADLRKMCEEIGLKNVATYIQSGNVIFNSEKSSQDLETLLKRRIKSDFGYDVPVFVEDLEFFEKIVSANPYRQKDLKKLYVMVLRQKPADALIREIAGADYGMDEFTVCGKVIYVYCADGYGKTKLNNNFFEKKLRVEAMTRNWNTINRVLAIGKKQ